MTKNKVRVGIVGAGGIAYVHEAGYSELDDLCQIVAVCDINEAVARDRAAPYQARVYTDYKALIADADVDMVDVVVPHRWHYPVALAALEQGKHVLVEKPMAMTPEQALHLITTAQDRGVTFTVAENTPFVAAYVEVERLLRANALGDIRFVSTTIAGSEVARIKSGTSWVGSPENQGVLLDSGVHSFYLMRWLFGGVRDVQAFAYKVIPESQVDDHAITIGHLANGAVFETTQSCIVEAPWTERLEVHGSLGSLIVDHLANPTVVHFKGPDDVEGTPVTEVAYEPLAWKYFSIVAEVQDFVRAILEGRPPRIDPYYGYHAIQVAEAAYASIAQGKAVSL
ncbi:MAG: Gfo/Idh/MocA family oxidoreductase [Ktedonobacteraceae bacterium]|nr:Gfo/Idh/MocA family oxidoreductase [Ktedonobacteraceae bacterium]